MPATSTSDPSGSGIGPGDDSRPSGRARRPATTATTPTGTLSRKAHRHPALSTTRAPSDGPIAPAVAPTAPHTASATGTRGPGNVCSTSARLAGTISAAPRACTARAATSASTPGATPQARGGRREHDHRHQEAPPPADPVGDAAGGHQGGGEHDRVGVEHPRQRAAADLGERAHEVGERHEQDRRVEEDGEHRQRGDPEDHPGPGGGLVHATTPSERRLGGEWLSFYISRSHEVKCIP